MQKFINKFEEEFYGRQALLELQVYPQLFQI